MAGGCPACTVHFNIGPSYLASSTNHLSLSHKGSTTDPPKLKSSLKAILGGTPVTLSQIFVLFKFLAP